MELNRTKDEERDRAIIYFTVSFWSALLGTLAVRRLRKG